MQLNVRDAAKLMQVSEKTIYRWVEDKKLPAFKFKEQYRFNRSELLEWATTHHIQVSANMFNTEEQDKTAPFGLADALKAGGIHYHVAGTDADSALKSAIELIAMPADVDKTFLLQVLLARESMGSTGMGNGIAIPHVRNPIVLHVPHPVVALCFLDHAIEFGAIDGKPVHTIFVIVSPTINAHLGLLSKLAFALRQPAFADVIARRGTQEEIFKTASDIDQNTANPVKPPVPKGDA